MRNPMKAYAHKTGHSVRHPSGAALIITLAMLILVSFVVVAFLGRSTREAVLVSGAVGGQKADILANSAAELIIADLKSEMRAGSTETIDNGVAIMEPDTAVTAMPSQARLVPPDPEFVNLIKQSGAPAGMFLNTAPYNKNSVTELIPGATTTPTTTASVDGRTVSEARWNKPQLLVGGNFTTAQVPNWVLMDRVGIAPSQSWSNAFKDRTPTNDSYIIGRFAYNIYDVSGLLDINVAGYPSTVTAADFARKGNLAMAAIENIPGIGNATNANKFVSTWRNKVSGGTSTNYLHYIGLGSSTTNSFYNFGPKYGFQKVANSASDSDNRILSRQDLIKLATNDSNGISTAALPYLTHFSRAVNAPSWSPPAPAGSSINYNANRNSPGSANRFLPNVRVSGTFTRADGTAAQQGEPLLKTRFPLSRLALIQKDANPSTPALDLTPEIVAFVNNFEARRIANGGSALGGVTVNEKAAWLVQLVFGLVWSSDRWIYAGPSGSTAQSAIKTLAQVTSDNREPNFFELLKASVLSGSLGKTTAADTGIANRDRDLDTDLQILKMGANIIDQADADDIPTFIGQLSDPPSGPKRDDTYIVLGIENHPYIYTMSQTHFRRRDRDYTPSNTLNPQPWVTCYQQMQVWNPHLNAASTGRSYRIRALNGESRVRIIMKDFFNPPIPDISSDAVEQAGRFIAFTGTPSFSEPVLLTPDNISSCSPEHQVASMIGFHIGDARADNNPSWSADGNYRNDHGYAIVSYDEPITFQLEFSDGGSWVPLQRIYLQRGTCGHGLGFGGNDGMWGVTDMYYGSGANNRDMILAWVKTDPRCQRFGFYGTAPGGVLNNRTMRPQANGSGQSAWESTTLNYNANSNPGWTVVYPLPVSGGNVNDGYTPDDFSDNRPSSPSRVKDPDGVLRPADGMRRTNIPAPGSLARPVILNRPFRSVGEMGYAFRDDPWKTLDLASPESADSALLDVFSVTEGPVGGVTAGVLNLNTRQQPVLKAVLASALKNELNASSTLPASEADDIATAMIAATGTTPLLNRAELATQIVIAGTSTFSTDDDKDIKTRRESIVRALVDVANTRTWNLMIDLVAQSGRYPQSASDTNQFIVDGEKRYWVHLAVDRFTGKVIDKQLEVVNE
jgi:hypothetical protein